VNIEWSKDGSGWISRVGEGPIFTARLRPKGDGRWDWEIVKGGGIKPVVATGIVSSLGAAKTVAANFVNRSGLV
jgi:hypothetical protein